jgi:hypothetical protein
LAKVDEFQGELLKTTKAFPKQGKLGRNNPIFESSKVFNLGKSAPVFAARCQNSVWVVLLISYAAKQ